MWKDHKSRMIFFKVCLLPCPLFPVWSLVLQFSAVNHMKALGRFSPGIDYFGAAWMSPQELWLPQPFTVPWHYRLRTCLTLLSILSVTPKATLLPPCYFRHLELKNCHSSRQHACLQAWAMKVLYGARGSPGQVLCSAVAARLLNDRSTRTTLQRCWC